MSNFAVGGITSLTSTDFPGLLAAVIFSQGCPWNCGYCHNPHLIPVDGEGAIKWATVMDFLVRRRGLLDGIVFSGGEPTLQNGLSEAIQEVREMGFKVGLHTGGAYPMRLKEVLPWVDWVGMDIKTTFERYIDVTRRQGSGDKARESAKILLESGVPYEFRTTIHPLLHTQKTLLQLATHLAEMGAKTWILQEFRTEGCSNVTLRRSPSPLKLDADFHSQVNRMFETFQIRHA